MRDMKYKPGDKVRIKSLDWFKANEYGGSVICDGITFQEMMTEWCGKELTIDLVYNNDEGRSLYIMKEPKIQWRFTDGMIEDLVDARPQEKMVSLDKVCEVLKQNISKYTTIKTHGCYGENFWKEIVMTDNGIKEFRKAMGD